MPVACNSNALTGSSGAVYYTPSGTKACLLATDFAAGGVVTVNSQNDFRVGDPIVLKNVGGAVTDAAYANAGTVSAVDPSANTVTLVNGDGTAIADLTGDGADNGGHVELYFSPASGICEVREWTVSMTRESLDVTTLNCKPGASAGAPKWAATKKTQPGYAEITGTLTLFITDNEKALGNRLMESTFLNNQDGASVELYMDLVSDGATDPQPDMTASQVIAGPVMFTDFSTGVNPDDPTQAEVSFTMYDPTHWIGQEITR